MSEPRLAHDDHAEHTICQLQREIEGLRAELDYRLRTEARFTEILNGAFDAIISMDHRGRVVDWNPAAEDLFGYSHVEAVGTELAELIVPERLRDAHRHGLSHYLESGNGPLLGKRIGTAAIDARGHEFPVELGITKIDGEGVPLFIGHVRDRRQVKQLLSEKEFLGRVSELLSSSSDSVATLSRVADLAVPDLADWCIIYLMDEHGGGPSPVAVASGDPNVQHVANMMHEPFHPDPDAPVGVPYVCRTGNSVLYSDATLEVLSADVEHPDELLRLTRELKITSWMCVPLAGQSGIAGAISLITTESGRRYTEHDVAIAEDLAYRAALAVENVRRYEQVQQAIHARDNFLSAAAHELKTRTTMLTGYTELLRLHLARPDRLPERTDHLISRLALSLGQMETVVNDLLDVSQIQRGHSQLQLEAVDLGALARSVVDRFQRDGTLNNRLVFTVTASDHLITGYWDLPRLEQALMNVLWNAITYSPQGGAIRMNIDAYNSEVVLQVQDEGLGIAEADRAEIFEPVASVGPGSGSNDYLVLGLYIARAIIEQHGGRVSLEGTAGDGSTVTVRLPLSVPLNTRARQTRADRDVRRSSISDTRSGDG